MNLVLKRLLEANKGVGPYKMAELIFRLAEEYELEGDENHKGFLDLLKFADDLRREGREEDSEDVRRDAMDLLELAEYSWEQAKEIEKYGDDLIEMAEEED